MKAIQKTVVMGLILGLAATASAIDVGGALKSAGKKAGKAAVQTQINNKLSQTTCSCKKGKLDNACVNKMMTELKVQHEVAEKGGYADFNVTANCDDTCTDALKTKMTSSLGWADTTVVGAKGTGGLKFSVELN